jgi:magnesium and cobalt transporter
MTTDRSINGSLPVAWRKQLCRMLGSEPANKDELLEVLQGAERAGLLDRDGLGMIEGVMQVGDLRVGDIMIPRAEMVSVRRDDPLERILDVAVESAHSRFPVTAEDKGEVVGILLAKDLLAYCSASRQGAFNIRDHLRGAVFVPESKRLNVLAEGVSRQPQPHGHRRRRVRRRRWAGDHRGRLGADRRRHRGRARQR